MITSELDHITYKMFFIKRSYLASSDGVEMFGISRRRYSTNTLPSTRHATGSHRNTSLNSDIIAWPLSCTCDQQLLD